MDTWPKEIIEIDESEIAFFDAAGRRLSAEAIADGAEISYCEIQGVPAEDWFGMRGTKH